MKRLFTLAVTLCLFSNTQEAYAGAPLIGTYIIPSPTPGCATLKMFLDTLNFYGVSGPVIADLRKDETAPSGGYILGSYALNENASTQLTLANSFTIKGNNHLLTAPVGTGSADGIFKIQGADFVTINDLNLKESAANTTATSMMEWGYAIVKRKSNDGVKTLTIQRCKIALNNTNTTAASGVSGYGASGVFIGNCLASSTAALTAPGVDSGSHDGIFIFQDSIENVNNGVFGYGTALVIDGVNYNDNGVTIMSNQVHNFTHNGVYLSFFNNDLVKGNQIDNMAGGGTAPVNNSINGVFYNGILGTATNNSWTCEQNNINLTVGGTSTTATNAAYGVFTRINGSGTTTISQDTVKLTASGVTATLIGINARNASGTQTITQNVIQDFTAPATNINHVAGIWNGLTGASTGYPVKSEITKNLIRNFDIKGGAIIAGCVDSNVVSSNPSVFTGNTVSNFVISGTATALKGYQYRNTTGTVSVILTATDNTFNGISAAGTTIPVTILDPAANIVVTADLSHNLFRNIRTGTGELVCVLLDRAKSLKLDKDTIINCMGGADVYAYKGGYTGTGASTIQISTNLVDSIVSNGASNMAAAASFTPGTSNPITGVSVYNSNIRRIFANGATGVAYGINVVSGTATYTIYNNMMSDITASSNTTGYNSSIGLNLQGTGVNNIYYNTVNLVTATTAPSGFGATGLIFSPAGTNTIQNNILRVNVTAGATNNVSAIRGFTGSASAAPSVSGFTAGSNIYFTPTGPNNFLYVEGTTNASLTNGFHVSGLTPSTTRNLVNDTFFNSDCGKSSYHKFMNAAMASREKNTSSEDNLSGSGGSYTPSGITYAEAKAIDISSVSTDISAVSRPSGSADIGALEFKGTLLPVMEINISSSTALDEACVYNLPTITATVPAYFKRVSYQWYVDDTVKIPGATGLSIVVLPESKKYTLRIYDSVTGCTNASAVFKMTILPPPPAFITYYDSLVFCESSSIVLNGNKGSGYIYQWYKDGLPIAGETHDYLVAAKTGVYAVEVNTVLGCPTISSGIKVTVYPLPSPTIFLDPAGWLKTQNYYSYQWYKDGKKLPDSIGTNRQYYTREDGAYTVEVTDSNGCTNKSTIYLFSTAIPEQELAAAISIFPNPVKDQLSIESPVSVSATLSDVTGRVLLHQPQATRLDMSGLAAGIYLLNISGMDGKLIRTEKVIRAK